MRIAGYAKSSNRGVVDDLLTSEQLDQRRRHAWLEFKSTMDKAVVAANKEVLGKTVLTHDGFLRLALNAAELRGAYIQKGIEVGSVRHPSSVQLDGLAEARRAFEETSAVFEALERVIERGYVDIPKA